MRKVYVLKGEDGYTKWVCGVFSSMKKAVKQKSYLIANTDELNLKFDIEIHILL